MKIEKKKVPKYKSQVEEKGAIKRRRRSMENGRKKIRQCIV